MPDKLEMNESVIFLSLYFNNAYYVEWYGHIKEYELLFEWGSKINHLKCKQF